MDYKPKGEAWVPPTLVDQDETIEDPRETEGESVENMKEEDMSRIRDILNKNFTEDKTPMINLHQKYNHYLHTDKILDDQDIHERIIIMVGEMMATVIGYYVLTENHILHYDLKERLLDEEGSFSTQRRSNYWRTVNPLHD